VVIIVVHDNKHFVVGGGCIYIVYYDYCTTTAFPTASITPSTQEVVVSDNNVRLTCSGNGDPNPTYTWRIQYENGKG